MHHDWKVVSLCCVVDGVIPAVARWWHQSGRSELDACKRCFLSPFIYQLGRLIRLLGWHEQTGLELGVRPIDFSTIHRLYASASATANRVLFTDEMAGFVVRLRIP